MKTYWIRGNITWKTAIQLERVLDKAHDGLRIIVNSGGGELASASVIVDLLRLAAADTPIETLAAGEVYSSAPLIVMAGGLRTSLPSTIWGVHYPFTQVVVSDPASAQVESDCVRLMRNRYLQTLAENSRKDMKYWARRLARQSMVYFTADEAFDLGLVDAVLVAPKREWD